MSSAPRHCLVQDFHPAQLAVTDGSVADLSRREAAQPTVAQPRPHANHAQASRVRLGFSRPTVWAPSRRVGR
jgi:hypothetical protein